MIVLKVSERHSIDSSCSIIRGASGQYLEPAFGPEGMFESSTVPRTQTIGPGSGASEDSGTVLGEERWIWGRRIVRQSQGPPGVSPEIVGNGSLW